MDEKTINDRNDEFSILNLNIRKREPDIIPSFYRDLNLDQIIDKMAGRWGKGIAAYYSYLPDSPEEEAYRRDVYGDIRKDAVYDALMTYIEDLDKVRELRSEKDKVYTPLQKSIWHIREVGEYCSAYEKLKEKLAQAEAAGELTSSGMHEFLRILEDIIDSDFYRKIRQQTRRLQEEMSALRFVITYDKDRISVAIGELAGEGSYEEMLKEKSGRQIRHLKNPFRNEPGLSELESACIEILLRKKPQFFREMKNTAQECSEYERPVLKRFEQEVIFYIAYAFLVRSMEKEGFCFSTPAVSDKKRMEAKGLYDLALALSVVGTDKKVVSNDLYLDEKESFFVLTGPNQGGKTTFARSLGQLVYFTRMGLDVPAGSATLPFFPDIQTHFSVEESVETGRGKLKEELVRLSPMMDKNKKGTFVVINELFTTAANYDAQIMGKKVLDHFSGLGCMGIYVTHLKELADEREGIVSLHAMLDENRVQNYKISRGMDEDVPCAENQVNKHRLTYEQLKERLSI